MNKITIKNYDTYYSDLKKEFVEFSQRKSDFQIEKFVACSDSTIPSHQYRHVLVQVRVALTELKRRIIDRERHIRTKDRAEKDKPEDWDLDVASAETEIENLEYDITSKIIEINKYKEILDILQKEHGKPFTNEEYQRDEVEYWQRRIAQQFHDSVIDRQRGCGQGNLLVLRQAMEDPIVDNRNVLPELPSDLVALNQIAKGSGDKPKLLE